MTADALPNFLPALPEMFLAVSAMVLLVLGAFQHAAYATREITWLSVLVLAITAALVAASGFERHVTLNGMFVTDGFAVFMKILVLLGSLLSIVLSIRFNEKEQIARFEYPVLVLLATTGMMVMISANDLISLYLGLELQNLALYVIASFQRDSERSTEAGLKYFVLGALSSGMLLYGASMIYGFAGTTNFDILWKSLSGSDAYSIGLVIGIVLIAVGLAFKVSAVPFHMWTPDVYEGAPTPATAFFSVAPKMAAMALFIRVMMYPFIELRDQWQQIIWVIAVASMLLGAFAAINQRNFKRLMAYSSIGHVGYMLIGLAAIGDPPTGVGGILIYLAIYLFMNIGTFGVILCMRRNGRAVERIDDLAGLSRSQPGLALALAIFMFSMAGIPPLGGFFAKFYIFMAAIYSHLYVLAVIGVVTSVVGAYYYIRIVKIMYFDEPAAAFDRPIGGEMQGVLVTTAVAILLFALFLSPIVGVADAAARTLFRSG
jgi:NADH-quinone oxidoreductase subunit N